MTFWILLKWMWESGRNLNWTKVSTGVLYSHCVKILVNYILEVILWNFEFVLQDIIALWILHIFLQILNWFTQLCLGVNHIHRKRVLHRDIKSKVSRIYFGSLRKSTIIRIFSSVIPFFFWGNYLFKKCFSVWYLFVYLYLIKKLSLNFIKMQIKMHSYDANCDFLNVCMHSGMMRLN